MSRRDHWEAVYASKAPNTVSWYRAHLDRSIAWIDHLHLPSDARIVDIGGGASTLVDDLVARGFTAVTVLDLAASALEHARARLGDSAARITWIVGDATEPHLERASVDLWHDRAVLHFLTEPAARASYVAQLHRCLRPGGHVILGTFDVDGPERCSGLPVTRYAPAKLAALLGPEFELVQAAQEVHHTPAGGAQAFAYALCRRGRG